MKAKTTSRRFILSAAIASALLLPSLARAGVDITTGNYVPGNYAATAGYGNNVPGAVCFVGGQANYVQGSYNTFFGFNGIVNAGAVGNFSAGGGNTVSGNFNTVVGLVNTSGTTSVGSLIFGTGNSVAGLNSLAGGQNNISTGNQSLVYGNLITASGSGSVTISGSDTFGRRAAAPANRFITTVPDRFNASFNGGYFCRTNDGQGSFPDAGLFVIASGTQSQTVSVPAFMGINKPVPTQALDVVGNGNFVGNIVLSDGTGTQPPIANPGVQVTGGNFPFVTTGSGLQRFLGQAHGGTATAPTAVTSGQLLVALHGAGHTGTGFSASRARIEMAAAEAWTNAANGTNMRFHTTPNGTTSPVERMRIADTGNVGIGTTTPVVPLDVVGSVSPGSGTFTFFVQGSTTLQQSAGGSFGPLSIRANAGVLATAFLAVSDERVKTIHGRSDSAADLHKLLDIEVTDYIYKDLVEKGNRPQKKVIAQQVEKVFSQAVTMSTDVVPDIYKKAPIKDGWVELATDLKVGDRVRLITEKGHRAVHEVIEVKDGKFRTDFVEDAGQVFVYGREVKDFRAVDYEAIAMLNVSATQELARKVEARDAEVVALRAEVAALKARDQAREARLARLEAAASPAPARAIPAVLKLGTSAK